MFDRISPDTLTPNDAPEIVWVRVRDAVGLLWGENPKLHDPDGIRRSIARYGFQELPKFDAALGAVKAGNGRLEALYLMEQEGEAMPRGLAEVRGSGEWAVPVLVGTDAPTAELARAYAVDGNNLVLAGGFDLESCLKMWDVGAYTGLLEGLAGAGVLPVSVGDDALAALMGITSASTDENTEATSLAERFIVPPFSVLDTRQGYWQERKRAWLALGIRSELGRGEGVTASLNSVNSERYGRTPQPETSIFDPVLCEVAYTWFCPPGGRVLDPFAGGSVRGIVAARLGREYVGVELRPEQVDANREQAAQILPDTQQPEWVTGDSAHVKTLAPGEYDFLFGCPPYYDLEVYGDLDGELSAMPTYDDFLEAYRHVVSECAGMLKDDRFACFVVGDIRDGQGCYRDFVSHTIAAFHDAGLRLYNEIILVNAHGSLPVRVAGHFEAGRKVGKTHQNVLVFVKGGWRGAAEACGPVEVGPVSGAE